MPTITNSSPAARFGTGGTGRRVRSTRRSGRSGSSVSSSSAGTKPPEPPEPPVGGRVVVAAVEDGEVVEDEVVVVDGFAGGIVTSPPPAPTPGVIPVRPRSVPSGRAIQPVRRRTPDPSVTSRRNSPTRSLPVPSDALSENASVRSPMVTDPSAGTDDESRATVRRAPAALRKSSCPPATEPRNHWATAFPSHT